MKKLSFIIVVFFICNLFIGSNICGEEINQKEIIAQSAILMDKETGRVLFEKNANQKKAMASTTKIMTCIVALENANLDKEIIISKQAETAPRVKLYIKEGESYLLEDLLYALMLESSNDVAVAIAEGVSGSVEEFCDLMTEKSKLIGALNTSFKTPNGLDAVDHYTTAYDLALITKYALDNLEFKKIITKNSHSFTSLDKKRSFTVNNKNAFLNMYKGANGVKTGYTGNAGYCFVGSVKREDMELIVVLLACGWPNNKTYKWRDTINLMDYGFNNYSYKTIIEDKKVAFKIDNLKFAVQNSVEGKLTNNINVIAKKEEKIDIIYNILDIDKAPIRKDDLLGEALIYIDNKLYSSVDIVALNNVERISYYYCLDYIWNKFILLGR